MPTTAAARSTELDELAQVQDDVVTRAQLRELGITRFAIRDHIRARRWRIIGRHVVVLHRGPLSSRQRQWVALLHAGPRAALAGLTAASMDGLRGWDRDVIHVIVPKSSGVPPLPNVIVHESRRLPESDIQGTRIPPRTRMPRSLVDAAIWMNNPRVASALLAGAVRERLVSPAQLGAALEAAGPRRHVGLLKQVVHDIEGGAQALSEIDFARLCRRGGLPSPIRQAVRLDARGRRRYLDAEWELPDGTIVAAEVDGAVHLVVRQWWADQERQNELTIAGTRVLRFPSVIVRLEPERVLDQLRRALMMPGKRPARRAP